MKTLSLFVDKWFITVAVNIDGNVMPLSFNGEDRIWLYFFEDTANHRVIYGKTYENNYRDKKPHYFGDIFPLIESNEHYFKRYDNRPEEMREIFKVSNIFSHLREAVQEEGTINTYISFSTDVSDIARLKFIQEIEEVNFKVVESVARVSHLALEESRKRGIFTEEGMYLVLVATNDNMHYALYKFTENLFVRKSVGSLSGFGLDPRKRSLIESVVENINRTTRFLSTPEEYAFEYKRQERFAEDWLRQIVNCRSPLLPVTFPDITFAVAPNNPYSVMVRPIDLDQRTECLVDSIVRRIAEYVRSNNIRSHEIKGIVFIGDMFTNTTFSSAINARFIAEENKLVKYREEELPKVVNVYTQIDCSQFSEAARQFVEDATTQEELIRQVKEEEERQKIAQAEAKKQQEEKDRQQKSEREYANAIENVERYESEHDYERMREWAELALTHLPDDEHAKEKLALAQQLLAEERANNKQYTTILQRAKTAYNEGRWTDAISQCDIILELHPESDEAKRMKREAKRQLEIKEKIINFLNRADMFFAQKLYAEALEEVDKTLNLDPKNSDAKEIKHKISEIHVKHEERINTLVQQLNEAEEKNDFIPAIQICELLIEEDVPNIRNWTSKKERLISKQKELEEYNRKLDELKTGINKAHFEEDWVKLKLLCENYLSISQNKEISQFFFKAQKRLAEREAKEAKEKALATINRLIIDRLFNEAEEEINKFAHNYPSEHSVVKDLRSKLFSFDSGEIAQTISEPIHKQSTTYDEGMDDDLFKSSKNQKIQESASKRASRTNKKTIDFFDSIPENEDTSRAGHQISDKDFNF